MRLTAPKKVVFWIATVIALIGLLGFFVPGITFLHDNSFLFELVAFILLWAGVYFKGF